MPVSSRVQMLSTALSMSLASSLPNEPKFANEPSPLVNELLSRTGLTDPYQALERMKEQGRLQELLPFFDPSERTLIEVRGCPLPVHAPSLGLELGC